jgi:hypothetical protein
MGVFLNETPSNARFRIHSNRKNALDAKFQQVVVHLTENVEADCVEQSVFYGGSDGLSPS